MANNFTLSKDISDQRNIQQTEGRVTPLFSKWRHPLHIKKSRSLNVQIYISCAVVKTGILATDAFKFLIFKHNYLIHRWDPNSDLEKTQEHKRVVHAPQIY